MPDGPDGRSVSCMGECSSKIFSNRPIHRPIYHHQEVPIGKSPRPSLAFEGGPILPITVPNVKKSRKRRDRRLSGIPPETTIVIRHDSDDDEDTPKRSRPIALQCMFWFCGILMVLLGAGALVYGIVLLCTSMDQIMKNISPQATHHQKIHRKVSGGTWTIE